MEVCGCERRDVRVDCREAICCGSSERRVVWRVMFSWPGGVDGREF